MIVVDLPVQFPIMKFMSLISLEGDVRAFLLRFALKSVHLVFVFSASGCSSTFSELQQRNTGQPGSGEQGRCSEGEEAGGHSQLSAWSSSPGSSFKFRGLSKRCSSFTSSASTSPSRSDTIGPRGRRRGRSLTIICVEVHFWVLHRQFVYRCVTGRACRSVGRRRHKRRAPVSKSTTSALDESRRDTATTGR